MMRATSILAVSILFGLGCGNPEEEGRKAAQRKAEELNKQEVAAKAAVKIQPPVPGRAHVPCEQLIDPVKFTEALAEVEPVTVRDQTASDAEAAAVCGILRGGVRPDQKQQSEIMKKNFGRLGTLPGDEICVVTAYCWTLEDDAKFRDKCKTDGFNGDESMGSWSCLQVVAQGAEDVFSFKFLDEDTKCILKVRGGPSMISNELITTCAKAARDYIGKEQIAVGADRPPPAPAAGSAAPAGTGSATP
jgi:hypothetical protein